MSRNSAYGKVVGIDTLCISRASALSGDITMYILFTNYCFDNNFDSNTNKMFPDIDLLFAHYNVYSLHQLLY